VARIEPLDEAREETLEHEQERLEAALRRFEVDRLGELAIARLGQRRLDRFAARDPPQRERVGTEPRRESAAWQREQVAHGVDAEARERVGERVIGVEQVDRQRSEERALALGGEREDAPARVCVGTRRARGEPAHRDLRHAARRGDRDVGGQSERERARGERAGEARFERNSAPVPAASTNTAASPANTPPLRGASAARGAHENAASSSASRAVCSSAGDATRSASPAHRLRACAAPMPARTPARAASRDTHNSSARAPAPSLIASGRPRSSG
jgi:hypothetical protein